MGNRVKGRVKPKSIKAPSHSGMSAKRKLSRMGKVLKKHNGGLEATFIGRAKVLKKLQVTLKDFRRLCILKGVFPREPRNGAPKNKKGQVYYHIKDVKALSHEPLLDRFREFRAFMKKVRKSANRNEKDEARRKEQLAPKYTLHHLVRERYPRFVDALSDMDDALCLMALFAALPSDGRIKSGITRKAQELMAAWGAYCSLGSSVTKSFVSVKGVYLEASIHTPGTNGQAVIIRWVQPHNFTQYIPEGVDFRVMLTFFEFYETLLGFVLFKLFAEWGVRYPLITSSTETSLVKKDTAVTSLVLHPTLGGKATSVLAANLNALKTALQQVSHGNKVAADAIKDALQENESTVDDRVEKGLAVIKVNKRKQKELVKSIDEALKSVQQDCDDDDEDNVHDNDNPHDEKYMEEEEDQVPIAGPLREALEAIADQSTCLNQSSTDDNQTTILMDPEAQKRRQLFHNLTFFLSREIPRGYLELIILSYGGQVGWEGQDSPISVEDASITHHVIDRPALLSTYSKLPKSREYVQPQWIIDSANFNFLLPIQKYGVGKALPPHLSPWVDDKEEGYVPKYKEEIEKLKNGEVLDDHADAIAADDDIIDDKNMTIERECLEEDMESLSEQEEEEENLPLHGLEEDDNERNSAESGNEEDVEEEEEDEEAELKADAKKQNEDEEAAQLAKALMSKKAARLYGRMQHGIAQKQAKVDNLHKKRREIENTRERNNDGKTIQKLKVDRLKKERRVVESSYGEGVSGGSMKKKRK